MLDDHEVEENWEGRPAKSAPDNIVLGKRAFVHHQLLLGSRFAEYPRDYDPDTDRYWYKINAGGFRFFVADTRTGRQRGSGRRSADSEILADEQMEALKNWLYEQHGADASKPKFVVSPSVVAPWARSTCAHRANALRSDAWDGFPDSLHTLFHFISENQIRNVVFLSGDYHASVFCELAIAIAGKDPVPAFSIVSSGLYSPYPFANTRAEDLQFSFRGTHAQWQGIQGDDRCCKEHSELRIEYAAMPYVAQDSFALITVARAGAQWRLEMQFNTEDGVVQKEISLS
jgi:phosphodiesterase/alkaline phosphatase D-like protein